MATDFYRFKLSDSLNGAKRTVEAVVDAAKLDSAAKVKASAIIEGIDGVIKENWKGLNGAAMKPLSARDSFILNIHAQDAIVSDFLEGAQKKAARNPKVAKQLAEAISKASAFNRVAEYSLVYAGSNYIAPESKELSNEQKDRIGDILKGDEISEKNVLSMLKERKPQLHQEIVAQTDRVNALKEASGIKSVKDLGLAYRNNTLNLNSDEVKAARSLVDLKIKSYKETMIGEALYNYSKDNGLNMYDVLKEASRQKLKPAMEVAEKAKTASVEQSPAHQQRGPITLNDLVAISPTSLLVTNKGPGLVNA